MQIVKATKIEYQDIVLSAVKILKEGGLVIYPTETCYGVAALATDPLAVQKLLEYKRRPEGKAVSIAVADRAMAEQFVELNETASDVYEKFLPGPVTVVSKSRKLVVPGLESEEGSLGVRIPDYPLALEIIRELGGPITATSANSSGQKTPYTVDDVVNNLTMNQKQLIDLILDAGELPHNPPSTVIDTTKEALKILRRGTLNFKDKVLEEKIEDAEAMQEFGRKFLASYKGLLAEKSLLISFNADLGAGKTQFVKGLAQELRIKDLVTSPTFILMKEYDHEYTGTPSKLIHLDAWRLESIEELAGLDLPQYFKPGNVIAVEWAGMAKEYLESIGERRDVIKVYIEIVYDSLETRTVRIYE